jgi:hypothetical protein
MTFIQQLYERLGDALPGMTTRRFSRLCGKSEGYYGSITAQQLPITTNALIYLAEMIEHIKTTQRSEMQATHQLQRVQQFIADEIARRTQNFVIDNLPVRKMIISAVANIAYQRDHQHNLPAIIFG